jgi:hypothetical protein
MNRRYHLGDEWVCDGARYRIVQGKKHPQDWRLDTIGPSVWTPMTLGAPYIAMDVIGQNEDVIHSRDYEIGAGKVRRALLVAYRDGWQRAWVDLTVERAHAAERLEYPDEQKGWYPT